MPLQPISRASARGDHCPRVQIVAGKGGLAGEAELRGRSLVGGLPEGDREAGDDHARSTGRITKRDHDDASVAAVTRPGARMISVDGERERRRPAEGPREVPRGGNSANDVQRERPERVGARAQAGQGAQCRSRPGCRCPSRHQTGSMHERLPRAAQADRLDDDHRGDGRRLEAETALQRELPEPRRARSPLAGARPSRAREADS